MKFFDRFREVEWYPHFGLLETLVQNGRIISMCLMAILLVVTLFKSKQLRGAWHPPRLMWPVHAIQVLLLIKMLTGSVSPVFIVQAAIVYALVAALGIFVVRAWLQSERSLFGPAVALTTALIFFCAIVEYELRINPQGVLLDNGRLTGTCGNPQHAAVLLAACLPGPLYLLVQRSSPIWLKICAVLLLVSVAHLTFLTGSRTGALMALIGLGLFFRQRAVPAVVAVAAIYFVYVFLLQPEDQDVANRLASAEDTRSHVWAAQWRGFLAHPLFGAPIRGDRLGFGENSWLAILQSTGVIGGAMLLSLLVRITTLAYRLFQLERRAGRALPAVDFCLAGLVTLFVGSFLEAYLLGIITLPILALLTYSAASDHLLEKGKPIRQKSRKKQFHRQSQHAMDSSSSNLPAAEPR